MYCFNVHVKRFDLAVDHLYSYSPYLFCGADCGSGRRQSSNLFVWRDLPNKLLSILVPVLFCSDDFAEVGIDRVEGADGI